MSAVRTDQVAATIQIGETFVEYVPTEYEVIEHKEES